MVESCDTVLFGDDIATCKAADRKIKSERNDLIKYM